MLFIPSYRIQVWKICANIENKHTLQDLAQTYTQLRLIQLIWERTKITVYSTLYIILHFQNEMQMTELSTKYYILWVTMFQE